MTGVVVTLGSDVAPMWSPRWRVGSVWRCCALCWCRVRVSAGRARGGVPWLTTLVEVRVRRYYEALNPGRFERLDDLLANEFVDHEELRGIPPTREGLKRKYTLLRAGFPDFGFTIEVIMYPVSTPGATEA
jgi:SnoaL-like polyketide cyclase